MERPGFVRVRFSGRGATQLFSQEAGGHRWQRVPPTEKRGRYQTSTVTVAVLAPRDDDEFILDLNEVDIKTMRGSGKGGQHKNKTDSCVVVTHLPTGLTARVDGRCQHQNRAKALETLEGRLRDLEREQSASRREALRRSQVGSGMRGDKVRTYRTQDDTVTDHRSGRRWSLKRWLRGRW